MIQTSALFVFLQHKLREPFEALFKNLFPQAIILKLVERLRAAEMYNGELNHHILIVPFSRIIPISALCRFPCPLNFKNSPYYSKFWITPTLPFCFISIKSKWKNAMCPYVGASMGIKSHFWFAFDGK